MDAPTNVLHRLAEVIEQRKTAQPSKSYTAQLLDVGIPAIGEKILEEAGELVEAASTEEVDPTAVVHETADLLYHALVLLAASNIAWPQIEAELARRFGTSGLEEKANRQKGL